MGGNYFEDLKNQSGKNKSLVIIIVILLIINLIMFKSVVTIASNKTIEIQVPTFLEGGNYVIGGTFANEKVFKMWTKLWIEELANYSYKDVRSRVDHITEFLAPETMYANKIGLYRFVEFVEKNYITQSFAPENFKIKNLQNGYTSISWTGIIKRQIGNQEDELSNLTYVYEFICYVRNGQIYIHSLKNELSNKNDPSLAKKLNRIEEVNFNIEPSTKEDRDKAKKDKQIQIKEDAKKAKLEKQKEKEEQAIKKEADSLNVGEIVPSSLNENTENLKGE